MAENIRLITPQDAAEKSLPRNIEAEAALLGALMIDNRIAEDVQIRLRAEHFFEPVHGRIYEAILKLLDRNMVDNPVTFKPLLDADESLTELGGTASLAQLPGSGAVLLGARDYVPPISDLARLRRVVGFGRVVVATAAATRGEV